MASHSTLAAFVWNLLFHLSPDENLLCLEIKEMSKIVQVINKLIAMVWIVADKNCVFYDKKTKNGYKCGYVYKLKSVPI